MANSFCHDLDNEHVFMIGQPTDSFILLRGTSCKSKGVYRDNLLIGEGFIQHTV